MNKRFFAFLLPGLLSFGCTAETDDLSNDQFEARAGELGSCTPDDCGGQASDGTCYCDASCSTYGDCCGNYEATCDGDDPLPPPTPTGTICFQDEGCEAGEYCDMSVCLSPCTNDEVICPAVCAGQCLDVPPALDSCEGSCGGQAPAGCWCDESCAQYGDCCEDKVEQCDPCTVAECGPAPGAPNVLCDDSVTVGGPTDCMRLDDGTCGYEFIECPSTACESNDDCDATEFCAYEASDECGVAGSGECAPRPEACIAIYDPVCGCDGETYGSACSAANQGMSVASDGECPVEPAFCGGIAGIQCPDGQTCIDNPDDGCDPANGGADCGGICVDEPDPNSCEGSCGGQAAGGCWCDDACAGYGDCCEDIDAVCSGTPCGDEVCGGDEVCVTNVTQLGPQSRCEPVSAGCEGNATCGCMGADVCTGVFDLCGDVDGGGISCACPVC